MNKVREVSVAEWVRFTLAAIALVSFVAVSQARNEQFGKQALANQKELTDLKEEVAAMVPTLETVSQALEDTRVGMEELLRRMNTHDVEDSRREAEIGHNRTEINRLRDEVH